MIISKENKIAGIIAVLVTGLVTVLYNQLIFHPRYKDISGCGPVPTKIPGRVVGSIADCFPQYREASSLPVYLLVFVGVPIVTFMVVRLIQYLLKFLFIRK